jgi:hypothetical protein
MAVTGGHKRLTIMLGLALVGIYCGTAAFAAKKPKAPPVKAQEAASDYALSDGFRQSAAASQRAMAIGDASAGAAALAAAKAAAVAPAEKYVAGQLALQFASSRDDPHAAVIAISDILGSGATPGAEQGDLRFLAGAASWQLGNYAEAITQLNYARQSGRTDLNATLMLADSYLRRKAFSDAQPLLDQAFAMQVQAGRPVPPGWYDKAIAVSYTSGKWDRVSSLYQQRLLLYPGADNWRTALVNSLAAPGADPQAQLDLYRLEAATGALASERDFQGYAKLASARGYDGEAKAIIEAGRRSGDLSASEPTTVALMRTITPKAVKELAALPANAAKAKSAATGATAASAGDLYLSTAQYPAAAEQYRLALSKGGVDVPRVSTRLGIALARSGDLAGGKAMLAQVPANSNWAATAGFWSVWIDQQLKRTAAQPAPGAGPA